MYLGDKFRREGLGETIRHYWHKEGISPPIGSDLQVWEWIERSDVAYSMVQELCWDFRLTILGAAACVLPAAQYVSPTAVELVRASERVAYGIDEQAWVDLVSKFGDERGAAMKTKGTTVGPDGRGGLSVQNPDWQDWGFAAVVSLCSAIGALRGGAPPHLVRNELRDAGSHAWRCLRDKFLTIDMWPKQAALRCANELQLRHLRQVVTPAAFTAPYTRKRGQLC